MYVQIINDRMRLWADDYDLDLLLRGAADAVHRMTARGARVIPPAVLVPLVLVPLDAASLAALYNWAIAAGARAADARTYRPGRVRCAWSKGRMRTATTRTWSCVSIRTARSGCTAADRGLPWPAA